MKTLAIILISVATAAAQAPLPEWKLGAAPQVAIGGDASPRTEFLNVGGVFRLSDANIAVVNRSTREIRVFDPRGAFVQSFGRKGQGPGEFGTIGWSGRFGDTVFVFDFEARRISKILFRGSPRLVGEQAFAVDAPSGESGVSGRLANGQWMVGSLAMPEPTQKTGRYRIPGYVGVANATTSGPAKWQPRMPDGDAFAWTPPGKPDALSLSAVAFGAELIRGVAGSAIWFGDAATDSLIRLDPATGTRKIIRLAPGTPLTSATIDAARARELENAATDRQRDIIRLRYRTEYLPKRLPTYESLVGGPRGELWVQRGAPSSTAPAEYIVLSNAGTPVARVTAPDGFRVMEIGLDYVTGVHKDVDGVETVRLYSLRRP